MEEHIFDLILAGNHKQELASLVSWNVKIDEFGLRLSEEQAKELIEKRNASLKKYRRVEFGKGILEKLIFAFCDSDYVNGTNFSELLGEIQDIFYLYKNESEDLVNDEELITFLREQFDGVCFGDTEYLAGTCLERLPRL